MENSLIFWPFFGHFFAIFAPVQLGAVFHFDFHFFPISGFWPFSMPYQPGRIPSHTPSTADTFRIKFRKKFRKRSQNSERFLEFPSKVRPGPPKPYNSRHLRLPEHFQNYLPPSTAGSASFFRGGSGEGHSQSWSWNSQQY